MYGEEGVYRALQIGTRSEAPIVGRTLLNDVRSFLAGHPLSDDLCIVCFGRVE